LSFKGYSSGQGIVGSANLATVYTRQIFFQVDPATLDYMDHKDVSEMFPRTVWLDLDPAKFLKFLPPLEAEIFWMVHCKKKQQKDVAVVLNQTQSTVSYRYRRTLEKLSYLMILVKSNPEELVKDLFFLSDREKSVLLDLMYFTNQEMAGQKNGVRQSSVKWTFVKTKKRLKNLEEEDPKRWYRHLGVLLLLSRNLNTRVLH